MKNIQNNPAILIVISLVVILVIAVAVVRSSGTNSLSLSTTTASGELVGTVGSTPTGTVSTSQPAATPAAAPAKAATKTYVPSPTSQPVSQISTLHGQATATLHCATPTSGRCQTGTGYSQFGVKVYQNNVLIQSTKLATDGTFEMRLSPGTYIVYPDWYTPGITVNSTWTTNLPKTVTLQLGLTTSLNFTIDYTQY